MLYPKIILFCFWRLWYVDDPWL